jgi:hypothetical protein
MASILVSRHLKTTEDLFDNRSSPRTESMVAAAVQWAERSMLLGVYPVVGIILLIIFLLGVSFQMHNFWTVRSAGADAGGVGVAKRLRLTWAERWHSVDCTTFIFFICR